MRVGVTKLTDQTVLELFGSGFFVKTDAMLALLHSKVDFEFCGSETRWIRHGYVSLGQ